MKLRYVFPLMAAAAIAGGATTYVVSEFNRQFADYVERGLLIHNERVRTQVFEREYRNLARSTGILCPDLPRRNPQTGPQLIFAEVATQVEKAWLEERERLLGNRDVQRFGPNLRILTASGNVEFLDVGYLCHSTQIQLHRYMGKLSRIGWHVVGVDFYEGGHSILVSPETGERISTFTFLLESLSARRLVAHTSVESDAGGLQIYRVEGKKLVSEFRLDPRSGTSSLNLDGSIVEVVGWIGDEILVVLLDARRQATLVLRDDQWQVQNVEPTPARR